MLLALTAKRPPPFRRRVTMNFPAGRLNRVALIFCVLALLPTAVFGLRTFRSFELLQSAYAAGAAKTSSIRPWMTLAYVAGSSRMSAPDMVAVLGLPPDSDPNLSLKTLADRVGASPVQYVQRVQRAIAARSANDGSDRDNSRSGWLGALEDRILTALLVYGYPVLGLTLLLGAAGLPLPDGIAAAVAGSLAAQGRMNWLWAGIIVVVASVVGDLVGYGLGRLLGREVVERYGGWLGFTPARNARVQGLFDRWGSLTVFITRTFVSYLSSVASLFAGMSRYGVMRFAAVATAGRVVWTAGYLGLGYGIGSDWEAATGFLTNLSFLVLALAVLAASALIGTGRIGIRSSGVT